VDTMTALLWSIQMPTLSFIAPLNLLVSFLNNESEHKSRQSQSHVASPNDGRDWRDGLQVHSDRTIQARIA
jgi:hypothetical protein